MLNTVNTDEEERFQVKVAWLYHIEGLTQGAIADHLGVTRLKVNRALGEALRNGVVRVSIQSPYAPCLDLEAEVKQRFGLKDASIAPQPSDDANVQPLIGAELGRYLSILLADPSIRLFGIGWGNTLHFATRSIMPSRKDPLEIISLMGGLSKGSGINSFEITTRLADLYSAERAYLTVPIYASTEQSRDTIRVQEVFQEVLMKVGQADGIAMGVGDISERSLLVRDGLPNGVTAGDLIAAGAVGDMLGYFIDEDGHLIDLPINRQVIGVSPFELTDMPNVILAAGGQRKIKIMAAALKTGIVDVLITDQRTAQSILSRTRPG
ncbi:MAG TPA: sugar-binding transcriptional regulator [Afifellaceae bacterium]|nr:sugar-binding transcriptional regulator [Afifellaceae bacterium]